MINKKPLFNQRGFLLVLNLLYFFLMRKVKLIYDFFRLWIKWGDRKEAWGDARFINDKEIQKELSEIDKSLNKHFENYDNGEH